MSQKKKVQLILDAEGTLMKTKKDFEKILNDDLKVDVFFLGNPNLPPDVVAQKVHEIIDKYALGKLAHAFIDEPGNIYQKCDILCEILLTKLGVKEKEQNGFRAKIEAEVKDIRDPKLFDILSLRYPEVAISILTTANPYQKEAYKRIVEKYNENVDVLLSQTVAEKPISKTDPTLYRVLADKIGKKLAVVDDRQANIDAANQNQDVHGEVFDKTKKGLSETTITAIEKTKEL